MHTRFWEKATFVYRAKKQCFVTEKQNCYCYLNFIICTA